MFNEQEYGYSIKNGSIEVICGPMFSGKTEELLRRLRRARIANQPIAIFKPMTDNRYSELNIVSHDANYYPSMVISHANEMLKHSTNAHIVAFDEAQFFDAGLPDVCEELASQGIRVIIAGLDMDFKGKPFGPMPQLLAVAEYITKVHAICMNCGDLAHNSYRTVDNKSLVMLGEKESYVPLCRDCYNKEKSKQKNFS